MLQILRKRLRCIGFRELFGACECLQICMIVLEADVSKLCHCSTICGFLQIYQAPSSLAGSLPTSGEAFQPTADGAYFKAGHIEERLWLSKH